MKHIVAGTPDGVRETLRSLVVEHRVALAPLSRMLRRPSGYLGRFVRGGGPIQLAGDEQLLLALYFRVDPRLFGEREDWEP